MTRAALAGLALALGCRDDAPPLAPEEPPPLEDRIASLRTLAAAAGYTVADGRYTYLTFEDCCLPGANCALNNPGTPYGLYLLPPAPGQTAPDLDTRDGLSRYYHLRADEAVVWLGPLPPSAKYFGMQSYLALEATPQGPDPVLASLGRSFNQLVAAEERGADHVFDAPAAMVTSGDGATDDEVRALLQEAGFPDHEIHHDRIPAEQVSFGTGAEGDWFMNVLRVAMIDDPADAATWYGTEQHTLLRLTPTVERPSTRPHPIPARPAGGSGQTESHLADALAALEAAVVARYPGFLHIGADAAPTLHDPEQCLADGACAGESPDRYIARAPPFLLDSEAGFAVAIGVNHARTGRASYSSLAVNELQHLIGLQDVNSDAMVGTARTYLPDHPQVDDLFACMVRRSCAGRDEACCLEVPYECPGVEIGDPAMMNFRAYLDPATGVAPLPEEMLRERVLRFEPAP